MLFKSKGTLRYDPKRTGMKSNTKWWLVVETDPGIVFYYNHWVRNNPVFFDETRIDLKAPSWGSHISVVRGETVRPELRHLWRKYDGEQIEFEYSHAVRRSGDTTPGQRPENFFFVEVHCDRLHEIRRELGLRTYDTVRKRHFSYHITVGRTYDE